MSKFLDKHPKLSVAFKGAAECIKKRAGLLGLGTGLGTMVGVMLGGSLVPGLPIFVGGSLALNGASGAYRALKAAKKNKQAPQV